jgi:hypothetical protein
MKHLILLAALSLFIPACATQPPVSGSISNKMGTLKLLPDGRIEIVIEPRSGK